MATQAATPEKMETFEPEQLEAALAYIRAIVERRVATGRADPADAADVADALMLRLRVRYTALRTGHYAKTPADAFRKAMSLL